MSMHPHLEPPAVKRGDLEQALEVAAALRNTSRSGLAIDEGETPTIVEVGAEPPEGAPRRQDWEPGSWCYELHVGCGEYCFELANVPCDADAIAPHRGVAVAIAQAGEVILGLVERIRQMEAAHEALATASPSAHINQAAEFVSEADEALFRAQFARALAMAPPIAPAAPSPSANDRTRYFIGLAEEELQRAGLGTSAERVRDLERLLPPDTPEKK